MSLSPTPSPIRLLLIPPPSPNPSFPESAPNLSPNPFLPFHPNPLRPLPSPDSAPNPFSHLLYIYPPFSSLNLSPSLLPILAPPFSRSLPLPFPQSPPFFQSPFLLQIPFSSLNHPLLSTMLLSPFYPTFVTPLPDIFSSQLQSMNN